ncbi:MAG: M23 family peptidase, partial [Comamonadaceae bacterium]
MPFSPTDLPLTRRSALFATAGLLALPSAYAAKPKPASSAPAPSAEVWPHASQVPGGVARLSLGPAATRPVALAGELPLLVIGDPI